MMNRLKSYMRGTLALLTVLLGTACTEEALWNDADYPNGVDENKMVELTLPFQLSEGIKTNIVTRATPDTDSQLSGIMVFVYENTGDPKNDKRLVWKLFSNPAIGELEHSNGGWIPDKTNPSCGKIKFHVPAGNCYIYLIANAQGSFLDFFPGLGTGGDVNDKLATLQGFWDAGKPKWTGNMNTVDGYLPMVGMVNNERGNCTVNPDGSITYTDRNNQLQTIQPNTASTEDNQSFILKRLMGKVSVKILSGEGVTFLPKEYRFRNVPTYVSPIEAAWTEDQKQDIPLKDTELVPFSAQSPNEFTVYLPEHVYTAQNEIKSLAEREAIVKINGKNDEVSEGHYRFLNAPQNATYLEITGSFEKNEGGRITQSADCRYQIHLGDFGGEKGFQDFSVKRDYHYTYKITVRGVNDIVVEVTKQDEINPAVEGIVFDKGARLQLDAHYEQVEMKLNRSDMEKGIYIYAKTPFGSVNCKYQPQATGGALDPTHANYPATMEQAQKLLQWIEFKQQTGKGQLATYGTGTTMNVFQALDDALKEGNHGYYTCFVDEYYYAQHPLNDEYHIGLSDFINAEDRIFSLGSDIAYSADGKSAVASAVYVLHQHAIACFYDLSNRSVAKYGVEIMDEIGELADTRLPYGSPAQEGTDAKNGRNNTLQEIANQSNNSINWAQNGFLLNADNTQLEPSQARLNTKQAFLACLTRNRDFNGDGRIEGDELRWYTPARDQMLGLWIGEPAMPAEAALYPHPTTGNLPHLSYSNYPIYTSTKGVNRVIWAEEGCSFGAEEAANEAGYVRAIRNLGNAPSTHSHTTAPDEYYKYNPADRTIEVYLTRNALRAYSSRELAPHDERDVVNRPYRKFQVAAQPYTAKATASCDGHTFQAPATRDYMQLQTSNANQAMTALNTLASQYQGNGETAISTASWRLPNQREMALMIVAMGTTMDYDMNHNSNDPMDPENYQNMKYECTASGWGAVHNWKFEKNYILHTRTSFSNKSYSKYGYMYNTSEKKIQMLWTSDEGKDLGQGRDGQGGYLCVRDVQVNTDAW